MSKKEIKINFGCLSSGGGGWINIDNAFRHILLSKIPYIPPILYKIGFLSRGIYKDHCNKKFKLVRYGDVRKKLKFKSSNVDYIYTSHMIEHLFFNEAIRFLKECLRILKKGGVIRIVVPDLEQESKKYLEQLKKRKSSAAAQNFCHTIYASTKLEEKYGHKWMYDQYSLKEILRKIGFSKIKKCVFKKGECPDLEKIEKRKGLIMEAKK